VGDKPTPERLQGKIAIVTGGNKGIGRTISVELAREGADVTVVAGHDLVGAKDVVDEIENLGRRGLPLLADVTRSDSIESMMAAAVAHFGRIDILVNNAGGGSVRLPLDQISEQDWDRVFAINTKSVFLCSTAAARRMMQQNSGVIVSIAGASAHRTYPRYGAFGPAKAAVVSFTGRRHSNGHHTASASMASALVRSAILKHNGRNESRSSQRKCCCYHYGEPERVRRWHVP
jgi:NAD(P)-dependent dehydrogenase (short-subunit alcohol dehydrogenase family)